MVRTNWRLSQHSTPGMDAWTRLSQAAAEQRAADARAEAVQLRAQMASNAEEAERAAKEREEQARMERAAEVERLKVDIRESTKESMKETFEEMFNKAKYGESGVEADGIGQASVSGALSVRQKYVCVRYRSVRSGHCSYA